jgi:RimJ/RimL family protein N-acetyltransferase
VETERLIIRPFRADDWEDLYEYLSDEEVVAFEPYPPFSRLEAVKEAERRSRDGSFWAVCLKTSIAEREGGHSDASESGKLIGNLYFARQEPAEFMTWELGYVFNRGYHGKGYATEAAGRMLAYGFGELDAHRVIAGCDTRNAPSWRLLERLGMRREGCFLKKAFFKRDAAGNPIWHDAYEYAILAEEFAR